MRGFLRVWAAVSFIVGVFLLMSGSTLVGAVFLLISTVSVASAELGRAKPTATAAVGQPDSAQGEGQPLLAQSSRKSWRRMNVRAVGIVVAVLAGALYIYLRKTPEETAINLAKNSHALGGAYTADFTIKQWLQDYKGHLRVVGWTAKKVNEQTFLVSYMIDNGTEEQGWFFEVNAAASIVRRITGDAELAKEYGFVATPQRSPQYLDIDSLEARIATVAAQPEPGLHGSTAIPTLSVTPIEQLQHPAALAQKTPARERRATRPWQTKQAWRRLRKGMTQAEVKSILGEPGKIDAGSVISFWYYPDILGGNVTFDGSERVEGWREP